MYYDRKGRKLSARQWQYLFSENPDGYRFVASTVMGPVRVSTVWVGLDLSPHSDTAPLIFETMIMPMRAEHDLPSLTDDIIGKCERHVSEESALAGHDRMCAFVRDTLIAWPGSKSRGYGEM